MFKVHSSLKYCITSRNFQDFSADFSALKNVSSKYPAIDCFNHERTLVNTHKYGHLCWPIFSPFDNDSEWHIFCRIVGTITLIIMWNPMSGGGTWANCPSTGACSLHSFLMSNERTFWWCSYIMRWLLASWVFPGRAIFTKLGL